MKKFLFLPLTLLIAASVVFTESCTKSTSPAPVVKTAIGTTLYDSLGGTKLVADPAYAGAMIETGRLGIRDVIDSTIFVIAADSRINAHFTVLLAEVTKKDFSGFTDLSENLTTFVAGATGAKDFIYIGLNMTDAHNPATNSRMNGKASNADFDAFVSDVVTGANKNKLPANLINSLGKILESLRGQVVQK